MLNRETSRSCPAVPHGATRQFVAAVCGLAVMAATVGQAPSAAAVTTLDCSTGPVVLADDDTSYVLRGLCPEVVLSAANSTVTMRNARYVKIRGSGNVVMARRVDTLIVAGTGGHDVDIDAAGVLEIRSAHQSVSVTERISRAFLLGQEHTLRATRVRKLTIRGEKNMVKVEGRNKRTLIKGSRNVVRSNRMERLRIIGSRNLVRVAKGDTKVSVLGPGNLVRVHGQT